MSVLKQISVDWARAAKLSNPAVLNAFRKRASDARIQNSQLLSAKTDIDFAHYRSILKNGAIVEEAEKLLNSFKAVDYDVSAQLKAIGAFESKAVESAKASAVAIEAELGDLNSTLKNIQDARPFNELTLDDVSKARPEITKAVESMISKGKWTVPGYVEKPQCILEMWIDLKLCETLSCWIGFGDVQEEIIRKSLFYCNQHFPCHHVSSFLSTSQLSQIHSSIQSGTLHIDSIPTPGAVVALQRLRNAGIKVRFCSNTSKESKSSLLNKLQLMGFEIHERELFTSLSAVANIVERINLNPMYFLSSSAREDFPPSTTEEFDSIVIGLAPDEFNYNRLNLAFQLLISDPTIPLIVTHKASYYRDNESNLSLGPGGFITALESCANVASQVVGKPTQSFFETCLQSLEPEITKLNWNQIGMVGDDWSQDLSVEFGGLKRFLVKTGKYRDGDELKPEFIPDLCIENFSDLVDWILK